MFSIFRVLQVCV